MPFENTLYKDLDLTLLQHPLSRDVVPLINVNSIKRSIRHLFFLDKYDVPFNSNIEAGLKKLLFEPFGPVTESFLRSRVDWIIRTYEPRVDVKRIDVKPDQSETGYDVTIYFSVLSLNTDDKMDILLKRVR